jgi:hypothetical protein
VSINDMVTFIQRQLDDDEAWARGANRAYPYADVGSAPPCDGVHWEWVAGDHWDPVVPDPVGAEFVVEPGGDCNLATVERWPSSTRGADGAPAHTRLMRHTYANSIVEMDAAAAGHIVRHDPANTLADVAAKRAILADIEEATGVSGATWLLAERTIRHLAAGYRHRAGWCEEWVV